MGAGFWMKLGARALGAAILQGCLVCHLERHRPSLQTETAHNDNVQSLRERFEEVVSLHDARAIPH